MKAAQYKCTNMKATAYFSPLKARGIALTLLILNQTIYVQASKLMNMSIFIAIATKKKRTAFQSSAYT